MSGFNVSTKKEDFSMRLRAQNMKNSKGQTQRLEDDNRKMEERLNELKTAMNHEKEERERQGGGFWGRGQEQTGSLTNYATEVLNTKVEKPPKEGKKKKIRIQVLQDTPLEVPKRSSQPGTMKYIAQRKLPTGSTPRVGKQGPKCGQCEDRAATLSCMQCSEIYCPGCFAAFHLKGALKQHRSVPLSAAVGPRVRMSPSPAPSPRGSQASGALVSHMISNPNGSEAAGPSPHQPSPRDSANSLLEGQYDESQSASSFQAALNAWRNKDEDSPDPADPDSPSTNRSLRKPVIASPVRSPVYGVDSSTGTVEEAKVPEIKFKHTLSYAERLMLKGHRRTELAEMQTPRLGEDSVTPSMSSQGYEGHRSERMHGQSSSSGSFSMSRLESEQSNRDIYSYQQDPSYDDEERVNFNALFEAVTSTESSDGTAKSPSSQSSVSVVEMPVYSTKPDKLQLKQSSTYVVQEVSPFESWNTEHSNKGSASSSTFVLDKQKQSSNNRSSTFNITPITELYTEDRSTPSNKPQKQHNSSSSSDNILQLKAQNSSLENTVSEYTVSENTVSEYTVSEKQSDIKTRQRSTKPSHNVNIADGSGEPEEVAKPVKQRPSSSKSKRPSSAQSKANKSRPGSRAQSRAGSRMNTIEGVLTKAPSDALARIASMTPSTEYNYKSAMEDFILLGVEGEAPVPQEPRTLTPSGARKAPERPSSRQDLTSRPGSAAGGRGAMSRPGSALGRGAILEKATMKVSNKLYQMAPRSWRPDSSLGEVVPLDQVQVEEEGDVTLAYSYSRQLTGQPVDLRASSSLSGYDFPNGDLGLGSVGMFGDELFTELAATATPTPRTVSALRSRLQQDSATVRSKDVSDQHSAQFSLKSKPANPLDLNEHRVPTPPMSSQGAATPVRDRLRRKADFRRSGDPSNEGGSALSKPNASGLNILPSKPGSFMKEKRDRDSQSASLKGREATMSENPQSSLSRQGTQSREATMTIDQKSRSKEVTMTVDERQGLPRQGSGTPARSARQAMSRHASDVGLGAANRPVSSRQLPATPQHKAQDPRPNSSTGASEAVRRSQPIDWSEDDVRQDSIVAEVMQSRLQADNWMDQDPHASIASPHTGRPESRPSSSAGLRQGKGAPRGRPQPDNGHYKETEVRSFSALSLNSTSGRREVRPSSGMSQASGRESRAIVMEGEDLSCYDDVGVVDHHDEEDVEALQQLEWELASDTGRVTADGSMSAMSVLDNNASSGVNSASSRSGIKSQKALDQEVDISDRIREDETLAQQDWDEEDGRVSRAMDEDEVRNLH